MSAEHREHALDRAVQARVLALGQADLGEPGLEHLGLAAEGAQHVEGVDVARALPDRVQRRLAEQQRHARTPRRSRCRPGTPAPRRPSSGCACRPRTSRAAARSGAAPPRAGRSRLSTAAASRIASAVAASDSTARSAITFCISGLSASRPPNAERCATCHDASASARAHQRRRAEHAVEPGGRDHLDDRAYAAALVAEPLRPGAVELQLGGGVGAVAQLVLEAYDVQPVALAGGKHARHQEAGEPARRLRQHEEHVVHRRGREPLVAVRGCTRRPPTSAAPRSRWRGRRTRPASRSCPCRRGRRTSPRAAAGRGRRSGPPAWASTPSRSRRRPAAPGPRRTSSRSGSRDPARSARRRTRRRGVRGRAGRRTPRAPPAARDRPRAPSASATRGGSAPRRCGCRSGRTAVSSGWNSLASMPCSRASAEPASSPSGSSDDERLGDACRSIASTSAASEVTVLCPTSGGAWLRATRLSIVMALP